MPRTAKDDLVQKDLTLDDIVAHSQFGLLKAVRDRPRVPGDELVYASLLRMAATMELTTSPRDQAALMNRVYEAVDRLDALASRTVVGAVEQALDTPDEAL